MGRDAELKRLVAEVAEHRLITLTGVGGVGKTRLAAEIAWSVADRFPGDTWIVELAPVTSSDAVAHAVAATLSIRGQDGMSMGQSVADALRGRRLLLVLDNCEHVLDAVAELLTLFRASCPAVALLATSREPIGVPAEQVWPVPPLPSAGGGVELFCERAAAADATFSPSDADLAIVATICDRLDGLPLAIELAAARVRSMTLPDLADGLHDRFRLLRGRRRAGLARHQTLRATVQWSYQLLDENERLLFDRLAVFAGGCDLASVGAVCADDGVDLLDVADLVAALVDKSMIVADRQGPHARYVLLETLRQYGEERLDERGEIAVRRDRHLAHYAQVARRADRQAKGAGYFDGVRVLAAEWDNLRAALDWAVATGDATRASAMVESLLQFAVWQQRHELGDWAERVVELDGARSGAYAVAAMFATLRGDQQHALQLAGRGIEAATTANRSGERLCVEMTGRALWFSGRVTEAWATVQRWETMINPIEEPFDAAWASLCLSTFAAVPQPASAAGYVERARRIAAPLDNVALATHIVWATGLVEVAAGHYEEALARFQHAMKLAAQTGDVYIGGFATRSLALLAASIEAGDAGPALHDALTSLYTSRNWMLIWAIIEALALYWTNSGLSEAAAVLLGYLEAHGLRHRGGGGGRSLAERRQLAVTALNDQPAGRTWMAHGAELDGDELVNYALSRLAGSADS